MKHCAQACRECGRCRRIERDVASARKTRKLLGRALVLLEAARWDLAAELQACGPDEVRQHPQLRVKVGLIARIEKLIGQVGET